jgi:hypothetical protein
VLERYIWRADDTLRKMLDKTLGVVTGNPLNPAAAKELPGFFGGQMPPMNIVIDTYQKIQQFFLASNYVYVCETPESDSSCKNEDWLGRPKKKTGLAFAEFGDNKIHLCINNIPKTVEVRRELGLEGESAYTREREDLARNIIHESCHAFLKWRDKFAKIEGVEEASYCTDLGCPAWLTPELAMTNPDSFAGFALWAYRNL